ncbi:MAG TPA: metallophosphoesterase family protein [Thermoanaerobaculia bacterium]
MAHEEPIAVLSDVHGNRWALEAVLADIARRGIATTLNLGDSLYGRLDPAGTADLLIAAGIPSIAGNQDRVLLETSQAAQAARDRGFVLELLTAEHLAWLAGQPKTLVHGDLLLCHGTPASDETYLLEHVTPQGATLAPSVAVAAILDGTDAPVVLCGHSHQARTVALPGGRLAVNPGSVGLPAYTADLPHPHVMEAGSPHARYAILEKTDEGWRVEHVAVPYAWNEAAAVAKKNGRADWAAWIETGRA